MSGNVEHTSHTRWNQDAKDIFIAMCWIAQFVIGVVLTLCHVYWLGGMFIWLCLGAFFYMKKCKVEDGE